MPDAHLGSPAEHRGWGRAGAREQVGADLHDQPAVPDIVGVGVAVVVDQPVSAVGVEPVGGDRAKVLDREAERRGGEPQEDLLADFVGFPAEVVQQRQHGRVPRAEQLGQRPVVVLDREIDVADLSQLAIASSRNALRCSWVMMYDIVAS